jgi:drug/metabolite transporter (DMT)-like permease
MELVFPLISVASIVLIALAYRWFRGTPVSKGLVSAAFGLVAFAGAAALVGWADDDSSRLMGLLAVLVGVALFALFQIGKQRGRRRPSPTMPQDTSEFL